MMTKPKYPLVLIEWEDASANGGWNDVAKYAEEKGLIQVKSVGWRTVDAKGYIQLVQQQSFHDGRCADSIQIPRGCIKKIKRLKE